VNRRWAGPPVDRAWLRRAAALRRVSEPRGARAGRRMAGLGLVVTFGILLCGRGFAYLGVAQANLYICEITMVAMVCYRPTRACLAGLLGHVGRPGRLHPLALAIVVFLGYGVMETVRGLLGGGASVSLLKSLPLYYYPVLLALGMWLGHRDPRVLPKLLWALAWGNAIYGIAYAVYLNRLQLTVPGQPAVPLFDLGLTGAAMAILGLLAFPRRSRWTVPLLLANVAVLFGHQIRAEWAAAAVSLVVYCLLTRRARRLLAGLGALVTVGAVIAIVDVPIPGPRDRGGSVRPTDILGRALGAFDPALASRFTGVRRAQGAAGTANFRQLWWRDIWHSATADPVSLLFGHGYAFNLQTLAPPGNVDPSVRSPHNIIFYSVGYTGLLGAALLVLLWLALARPLWTVFRRTGDPVGLCVLACMVTSSQFEPFLESPFGAAALYLPVGMCLAPLLGGVPAEAPATGVVPADGSRVHDPRPVPVPVRPRVASRVGVGGEPGMGVGPGATGEARSLPRRPAALAAPGTGS
jgi:hypothetical protein